MDELEYRVAVKIFHFGQFIAIYTNLLKMVGWVKCGPSSLEENPSEWWPKMATINENIEKVHNTRVRTGRQNE